MTTRSPSTVASRCEWAEPPLTREAVDRSSASPTPPATSIPATNRSPISSAPLRRGIAAAGGIAVEFPVMSLGEDLMKPSSMLYRNLLAMELEESLRSQPLDAIVVLGRV